MGFFFSLATQKRKPDWEPRLFMSICSLTASKCCSVERDTVRLPDLSQAYTPRIT